MLLQPDCTSFFRRRLLSLMAWRSPIRSRRAQARAALPEVERVFHETRATVMKTETAT